MKQITQHLFARLVVGLVKLIGRILFRIRISGSQNIPSEGGALIVANHTSYMDFILMVCSSPRPVHFVMNADIFRKPLLRPLLEALHCIPISPRQGVNDYKAFNETVAGHIRSGKLVAIFAEGTVTRTGQILEFKKGVEHLSRIIDAPIIPMHFDNVSGTPFSYRAGMRHMIRVRLHSIRKKVGVKIGAPIQGPTTAFALRQVVKELEAENFAQRLEEQTSLEQRLQQSMASSKTGNWTWKNGSTSFNEVPRLVSSLHEKLQYLTSNEPVIAVQLPKSEMLAGIIYWAMFHHKTLVPIDPLWSNEERLYIMNASGANVLITTKDLGFTLHAPVAEVVVYQEDLEESIRGGKALHPICRNLRAVGKSFRSIFYKKENVKPLALFAEKRGEELQLIPMYASQVKAVIEGMRQIYFFKKGIQMLSDLPVGVAYGYVLEWIMPVYNGLNASLEIEHDTATLIAKMSEAKPELIFVQPHQLKALSAVASERNMPFLTHVFTADVHPMNDSVQTLIRRGIQVMTCAGMNASASVFAVNLHNYTGRDIVGKPLYQEAYDEDSLGKALPGVALKIVSPNDHSVVLGCEEVGRILIKGAVMEDSDQWHDTGHCGWMDHKGFVHAAEKGEGYWTYSEAC
jgi:acyl-[acyl-carrier-protein]-phospholipid O-acyltransferase/long-chain-fatty-acid--[acyl-carrier-protein] ligase